MVETLWSDRLESWGLPGDVSCAIENMLKVVAGGDSDLVKAAVCVLNEAENISRTSEGNNERAVRVKKFLRKASYVFALFVIASSTQVEARQQMSGFINNRAMQLGEVTNEAEDALNSKLALLGSYDQNGTLWVYQEGNPYTYRYGYGHLFQAVSQFDKNSDCSDLGVEICEGLLGYAHGTEPGAEVDGFEVRPDPNYPNAFLYYVKYPIRIDPVIVSSEG